MPIISVRDNENNRWKRSATKTKNKKKKSQKTNKDRKEKGGTEAIVKRWEINDFVVHLS